MAEGQNSSYTSLVSILLPIRSGSLNIYIVINSSFFVG